MAKLGTNIELCRSFLQRLPKVDFAFAYGSSVFSQLSSDAAPSSGKPSMIDLIVAVQDSQLFHAQNLKRNRGDYSFLGTFGASSLSRVQNLGAGVYFNTGVKHNDQTFKYGVVSMSSLTSDLDQWTSLYISGRMQKPVEILQPDETVARFQMKNLDQALSTALLLLPAAFTDLELHQCIAGLSYGGDVRMGIAENPNKVKLIAAGSRTFFDDWYKDSVARVAAQHRGLLVQASPGRFQQDKSPEAQRALLQTLPESVIRPISPLPVATRDQIIEWWLMQAEQESMLRHAVDSIVRASSLAQTTKGVFTAGPLRALQYALAKLRKRRP